MTDGAPPRVPPVSDAGSGSKALHARVLETLAEVIDPELGMNVVELGLVYGVDVEAGRVHVRLTMTTPACPLGEQIMRDAEERVRAVAGVEDVDVELVWEPPWTPSRMSPSAREALGWSL